MYAVWLKYIGAAVAVAAALFHLVCLWETASS